ncbi:hypothetical protein BH20ACI2_BH20ACI2_18290 [soil metagenome]
MQIWVLPEKERLPPDYEQRSFAREEKLGKLKLVASRGGVDGSIHINQDVKLYASILSVREEVSLGLAEGRHAWVQLVSRSLEFNDVLWKQVTVRQ